MMRVRAVGWVGGVCMALVGCGDGGSSPGVSSSASHNAGGETSGGTRGDTAEGSESDTGVDTFDSAEGTGATGGSTHAVDCNDPPLAAVGAAYQHAPVATGFPGTVSWQIQGLPDGMVFSPVTGAISGAPAEEGSFDVEVTASGSGLAATEICTIDVGAAVSVDLSALAVPCIGPDDDVLELVAGGDGSPVTCHTPAGNGNGTPPSGVSVDTESCAIAGDPDDTFGTWVWMTEVRQSGARAWVPFCVTEHDQAPDAYGIAADHSGGTNNVLEPAVGSFTAGEPIAWGGEGDPSFLITGPCGPSSCYYGFAYTVTSSPFGGCADEPCYGLSPSALATDDGSSIGFTHEMFARGPAVSATFETRPFVLGWTVDYCISSDATTCAGVQNIKDNGNGRLRFSVVMFPQ